MYFGSSYLVSRLFYLYIITLPWHVWVNFWTAEREHDCVLRHAQKLILLVAMVSAESSGSQSLWSGSNAIFTVEWRRCGHGMTKVRADGTTEDRLRARLDTEDKKGDPFLLPLWGRPLKCASGCMGTVTAEILCREDNVGITLLPPGKKRCEHSWGCRWHQWPRGIII